ncbi:MAG: 2Fe-2S iron-sulfur cluster-binding protein [Longimonas sp.]|uniref:2Fe-2S iron-sulfur cluster-binding protein n=1 Tax=Longimonas sp. TaxID=2039626 RepID=UPI003353DAD4
MGTPSSTQETSTDTSDGHNKETSHTVSVYDGDTWHTFEAEHGRTLREVLWEHDVSPHGQLTSHLNCGGQGHCAACTVEVQEGDDDPDQWLDAFLSSQDMGRLSCQIDVTQDMTVRV